MNVFNYNRDMLLMRYILRLAFAVLILWLILFFLLLKFVLLKVNTTKLHWYFHNGLEYPFESQSAISLFGENEDRIVEQLMYLPPDYTKTNLRKKKKILAYFKLNKKLKAKHLFRRCPVSSCVLTDNKKEAKDSDAIIFIHLFMKPNHRRSSEQIWILYMLESPVNVWTMKSWNGLFNWTATYRRDSDIVTPYGKWVYYDNQVMHRPQTKNYANGKTKKVAWFVSNCYGPRFNYATELKNYTSVDIYGKCGSLKCLKKNPLCFNLLKQYKFYLSFENSNCRDYITEKFFENAFRNNLIPIAMGPNKEDYIRAAPKDSFIHVNDFKSPKDLALRLDFLDKNDEAFNSYFKWKGTGEFINTHFWCRICALLHSPIKRKYYEDIHKWWEGSGICKQ